MGNSYKLGVIGAGYMATSIIKGCINSGALNSSEIIVSDININFLNKFSDIGITTTQDNLFLANSCEFVLFAVKPQNVGEVINQIKGCSCNKFISIMAGVKKQKIKDVLGSVSVARCMPNAPCAVGNGAVGIDLRDFDNQNDISFIKSIFSSISTVIVVEEEKLNAVTGISGSAPAYFYLFAKGLIDAGIKNGLTEEQSKNFVVNTMIGSGKMLLENNDKSIQQLIDSVCSKGGTTIEAIKIYLENDITGITDKAVDRCIKRSYELENV